MPIFNLGARLPLLIFSGTGFIYLRLLGRIQDFWKEVHMYKDEGVRFADLSHFSLISHENEII